jgi:hypothetical protein
MKIYFHTKRLLQLQLLWHMYVVVVVIDKRLPLGYRRKKNVHKFFFEVLDVTSHLSRCWKCLTLLCSMNTKFLYG